MILSNKENIFQYRKGGISSGLGEKPFLFPNSKRDFFGEV